MDTTLDELYPELPNTDGLPPRPLELLEKVRKERAAAGYRPRTRHLLREGFAKYTNRLFLETSPYLLQHAHNPVNWFPWGEEPFGLARQLGRPVMVSIGYATCHWCHVMEEESFEDEEIAQFLNVNFIAVKVDREERPDIDAVYMSALHAMGSQGGWPMTVFLTPDKEPFYGGTYFPPYDHKRGIGFLSLLRRLQEAYRRDPERLNQAGRQLAEAVRDMLAPPPGVTHPQEVSLDPAVQIYRERFDQVNGGLTEAPKFPSSLPIRLLLRQYKRTGERELLSMAHLTLKRMAAGGIYDQIGGGFHRYATDERWLIPHFEKMLYDNALLTVAYLEGYQATGDGSLASVAGEILGYLQREMAAPGGGFYSATDADSPGSNGEREEGAFFTWTPAEIVSTVGRERGEVVAACYGISATGNFEGRSIPHRERSDEEMAGDLRLPAEKVRAILEQSRDILYQARRRRPLPLRDEKVLVSWNALAMSAFARGGLVLNQSHAVDQARHTALFIMEKMMKGGRLAHSYQEGEVKGKGFLDDYAFLISGLLDLFEVTGEACWLECSLDLTAVVQEEFADEAGGGYFMTGNRHEELIAREKPAYDGAVPSGNSVMVMNLLRLNSLTEKGRYLERARGVLDAFASRIVSVPAALSEMLVALDFLQDIRRQQIVIVAPYRNPKGADPLLDSIRKTFLPNTTFVITSEGEDLDRASRLVPMLGGKTANGELAVAYLCQERSCLAPTSEAEEFGRQLSSGLAAQRSGAG